LRSIFREAGRTRPGFNRSLPSNPTPTRHRI
jgi:hypothetical protein